jgi:hypothetical protein
VEQKKNYFALDKAAIGDIIVKNSKTVEEE